MYKVSIVAPAGAIGPKIIDQTELLFESMGFSVAVGKYARGKHFVFSGTIDERIHDLQEAMDNSEIDAIFCARGGYGTVQLIHYLNFTEFVKHPKWIIGFSDITVLHLQLAHLNIPSLHADMLINYAESPNALTEITSILKGNNPHYELAPHPCNKLGQAEGLLTGGNLSIINGLRATPYDLISEGRILFLEDLNEDLYHIERLLYNLKLGGVFVHLSGLIVGQFTDIRNNPPLGESLEEIILRLTQEYSFPILFNFPSGHVPHNKPLVMNAQVQISVNESGSSVKCVL